MKNESYLEAVVVNPSSSLFDFIKNIRQTKTFKKIEKKSKVKKVKIDGKSIVLDKESGLEILEEVLYKLVPKEKDPRRLWRKLPVKSDSV